MPLSHTPDFERKRWNKSSERSCNDLPPEAQGQLQGKVCVHLFSMALINLIINEIVEPARISVRKPFFFPKFNCIVAILYLMATSFFVATSTKQ